MNAREKYRLITRHDFDGLVSAILLKELGMIGEIEFVHPKDMQDGKIAVTARDITTNLPYAEGVHLAFDHHLSEAHRLEPGKNFILDPGAPSASQVVFEHFGGAGDFPGYTAEMMTAVNKADSGQFTREEILHPMGWNLLNFILDPRTGLGRFRNFAKSGEAMALALTNHCRNHPIEWVMKLIDITERTDRYFVLEEAFRNQIRKCAALRGNILVVDLREEELIMAGNRFIPYALFPEANISIHVIWGKDRQNTVFAVGKSIFNRTSRYNIGVGMLGFGGGGHEAAGTCQISNDRAGEVLEEIIRDIGAGE